ncbi:glutaredoxin family protein [Halomonas litopenaei]|uniref:glutaredoxin family protein n=1 Tax=Halomonas litopenaei TaxID=2109328 RepID=UPI003F9F43F9
MTVAKDLALYHFAHCPFCAFVRRELDKLGVEVDIRDAGANPAHRKALKEGGGKIQVPCLLITHEDGRETWMYESMDIVAYFKKRFSEGKVA